MVQRFYSNQMKKEIRAYIDPTNKEGLEQTHIYLLKELALAIESIVKQSFIFLKRLRVKSSTNFKNKRAGQTSGPYLFAIPKLKIAWVNSEYKHISSYTVFFLLDLLSKNTNLNGAIISFNRQGFIFVGEAFFVVLSMFTFCFHLIFLLFCINN